VIGGEVPYVSSVKKRFSNARARSPEPTTSKKPRLLKKYLGELRTLYHEAVAILKRLLIEPSADVVCSLCARFRVLQEDFFLCYKAAQTYAISALGAFEATLYFP
jgi:hypothetical protein